MVNHFPIRKPLRLTPRIRAIPAATSEVMNPLSAASAAKRLIAVRFNVTVDDDRRESIKTVRYLWTVALENPVVGRSFWNHSINLSTALAYARFDSNAATESATNWVSRSLETMRSEVSSMTQC